MPSTLIPDLEAKLARCNSDRHAIIATARKHGREQLSAGESKRLDDLTESASQLSERIAELREQDANDAAAGAVQGKYQTGFGSGLQNGYVTRDQHVYRPDNDNVGVIADFYRATRGDVEARERLDRNRKLVHEQRAISTTNGAGGEFVPPLWLEDEWIAALRAGRVTADLCVQEELPQGTDVLNVPKINTGAAVAQQVAQNTPIQQTDMTTTSVSAPVITLSGGQTISMQLVEQSPGKADRIVLMDLAQDYARSVGYTAINGATGLTGLLSAAGNTVPYTDASPALMGTGKLYNMISKGITTVQTGRFLPPDAIIMHPRRWNWIAVQTDASNRPAVLPEQNGPFNASAVQTESTAQGAVGHMFNLPVYIDPQIPTNLGAGANQDAIVVARMKDVIWYEQDERLEAFAQTYAQNLSLFVRLYNYVSMIPRVSASIAVVTGTGTITPTF